MNKIRIYVRVQGEGNKQAIFDVLAGKEHNVTMETGFDKGGWATIEFDAVLSREEAALSLIVKDWKQYLQSLFPTMRISVQ